MFLFSCIHHVLKWKNSKVILIANLNSVTTVIIICMIVIMIFIITIQEAETTVNYYGRYLSF